MSDQEPIIKIEGLQEVINQLDFLDSLRINDLYLKPAMKSLSGDIKKAEQGHIPVFSGKTAKSLSGKVSENGVGAVTLTLGPKTSGKNARAYIFRFIGGGALWSGRSSSVTTWRGKEKNRNMRAKKAISEGRKANSSFLPAIYLVEWVKKKLHASDDDALQTAFRVAKTIGSRGLPAKPIVPPTVQEVRSMVISRINQAVEKMVQELPTHGK